MKINLVVLFVCLYSFQAFSQSEMVISPSNGTVASLEKNMLFYADKRFAVSQSGSGSLDLKSLFDGSMAAVYTASAISPQNPYVLLIENLPNNNTMRGAWIGWSARYRQPRDFKIEVYDQSTNQWSTIADKTNNVAPYFITGVPYSVVNKIKITIYQSVEPQFGVGLSEVFFIHPEVTSAYDKLLVNYDSDGKIKAREIRVEATSWPDYVFEENYALTPLDEVETYIHQFGHLPEIPKAAAVESEGLELGEFNKLLLKKIEELTLHLIDHKKRLDDSELELRQLKATLNSRPE